MSCHGGLRTSAHWRAQLSLRARGQRIWVEPTWPVNGSQTAVLTTAGLMPVLVRFIHNIWLWTRPNIKSLWSRTQHKLNISASSWGLFMRVTKTSSDPMQQADYELHIVWVSRRWLTFSDLESADATSSRSSVFRPTGAQSAGEPEKMLQILR